MWWVVPHTNAFVSISNDRTPPDAITVFYMVVPAGFAVLLVNLNCKGVAT